LVLLGGAGVVIDVDIFLNSVAEIQKRLLDLLEYQLREVLFTNQFFQRCFHFSFISFEFLGVEKTFGYFSQ